MITLLIQILRNLLLPLTILLVLDANGQTPLDKYVETGIANNQVLQQKNISLEKAMLAIKVAKSMFMPAVGINGSYQSGQGGRSIALPIGDIMNPVYTTLNQLTASNNFPQISNVETTFFPQNFYDIKLRTSMPLINSDLIYNQKIEKQQAVLKAYDVEIYKFELIRNIKVAYYNYLSATQSVGIYNSALNLATEGKRINESLLKNGKSVKAYVIRSESEVQQLEAMKNAAIQQQNNAQFYFNFLINTPFETPIDTTGMAQLNNALVQTYLVSEASVAKRSELKAINQSVLVYENVVKMNKAYWYPRLSAFVDLGSQGSNWQFDNKSRYYFLGVQLDVPLFAGGKNHFKTSQSQLDLKNQNLQTEQINRQLQLSAKVSKNALATAYQNYLSAVKQAEAAQTYNYLIETGYKEGVNTFIETIDARNQLTTANLQMVISKYQLLSAVATYEREISN
jgi:outer membrane protein TolC